MATNTFTGTGNWSDNARWSLGRPPTIANVDKIAIANAAICTLDGVYGAGDDTTTAITIGGTLRASRSVSSGLTVRGALLFSTTTGDTRVIDFGTEADPIPPSISAVLELNDSALQSNNKYGFVIPSATAFNGFRFWGSTKNRRTSMAAAGPSDTSIVVDDASGWQIGDILGFGPSSSDPTTATARQVTSVSGSGPYTVGINAGLGTTSPLGRKVVNLSSNVKIRSKNPQSFYTQINLATGAAGIADSIELGHVEIQPSSVGFPIGGIFLSVGLSAKVVKRIHEVCINGVNSVAGSVVTAQAGLNGIGVGAGLSQSPEVEGFVAWLPQTPNAAALAFGASANWKVSNPGVVGCVAPIYAAAPVNVAIEGGFLLGALHGTFSSVSTLIANISFNVTEIDGCANLFRETSNMVGAGPLSFVGCDIGASLGFANAGPLRVPTGEYLPKTFSGCNLPSVVCTRADSNLGSSNANNSITIRNKNNDPTLQYRYTYGGEQIRDNSVTNKGTSSVRFDCWYAANPMTYSFTVPVAADGTITLVGSTRYNALYGTTYPPKVTISGLGITPVEFTDPATGADQWHEYTLTATNPNSYPGEFIITYTGQSAADATGAYCWFSGVYDPPWVDSVRHYGYLWQARTSQVVDPDITLSESAALALPVTVDNDVGLITVTADATSREVKAYCIANLAKPANQTVPVHITSLNNGDSFSTTYDVVIETGVTVTGDFVTAGTVTLNGTADVDGVYTDSAGRHVKIAAPNLIADTWCYLYNITDNVLLSKVQITTAGMSIPVVYTTDKQIEYRFGYSDAATRKYLIQGVGVLGSSGLSIVNSQVDDPIYAAIAGDPATFTEFVPDFPNLQVDTPADFLVPRLYKWATWAEASSAGIELMAGAVSSDDGINVRINVDKVDAMLQNPNAGTNVFARGGYIYRSDGSGWIVPGPGIITPDFGRAYPASGAAAETAAAVVSAMPPPIVLDNGEQLMTVNTSGGTPKYLSRG